MIDKLAYDTEMYTNLQELEHLRYAAKNNPQLASHEMAKEFQGFLLHIMLKSMSECNKQFSGGLFGSDQMDFYDDLFNQQLSLELAKQNLGFTQIIEKNLAQHYKVFQAKQLANSEKIIKQPVISSKYLSLKNDDIKNKLITPLADQEAKYHVKLGKLEKMFNSKSEFVQQLWQYAKEAASKINIDPKVLLAQAALETNWGNNILSSSSKTSSYNLFNIKADQSWINSSTSAVTFEEDHHILKTTRAKFRVYESFRESFNDYVNFLKNNDRYQKALQYTHQALNYLQELQKAGFATDSFYAQKIHDILNSPSFNLLINQINKGS